MRELLINLQGLISLIRNQWLAISCETRDSILSNTVILAVSFISTLILSYLFNSDALASFTILASAICYQITHNLMLGDHWYSFESAVYRLKFIICLLGIIAGVLF